MKICPICKLKFSDQTEFCPKCQAQLQDLEKEENAAFEGKRVLKAILWTCGFMAVVAGLYYLASWLI